MREDGLHLKTSALALQHHVDMPGTRAMIPEPDSDEELLKSLTKEQKRRLLKKLIKLRKAGKSKRKRKLEKRRKSSESRSESESDSDRRSRKKKDKDMKKMMGTDEHSKHKKSKIRKRSKKSSSSTTSSRSSDEWEERKLWTSCKKLFLLTKRTCRFSDLFRLWDFWFLSENQP